MISPIVIIYSAGAVLIILIGWIIRLEVKMKRLLRGKNAESLEETLLDAHKKLDLLAEFRKDALAYFTNVEERLLRSVQAVETKRFNPFKGTGDGGNQSFSTALITEEGNGVVVSSLYSRDRVSIFSKPVQKFTSEYELTEEEKEVVGGAKQKLASK